MKALLPTGRLALISAAIVAIVAVTELTQGPEAAPVEHWLSTRNTLALAGYDPVSFHLEGVPKKGAETFSTRWNGREWHFSNPLNLSRFIADPERYAPQFDGYSVFGMARGKTYKADPQQFDVIDGKLYLSRNAKVRELWRANPDGFLEQAERNWLELRQELELSG